MKAIGLALSAILLFGLARLATPRANLQEQTKASNP